MSATGSDAAPSAPALLDVLEALLFASDTPIEPERMREVLELDSAAAARELAEALRARLDEGGRPLQIVEVGGGYRMVTRPELAPWLVRLARARTRQRLSRPALETLAIVAYRQPVSRPEIDAVRGVNSEAVLESLLDRRVLRIAGRRDAPGRPFLYETTREFLVAFGLRDLRDLPKVEGQLVLPDLDPAGPVDPGPVDSGTVDSRAVDLGGAAEGEPTVMRDPTAVKDTNAHDPAREDPGPGGPQLPPGR